MGQVSRKFDLNPPIVRSICILSNLYKAKEHLDQSGWEIKGRKTKEREKPFNYTFILGLNLRTNT